MSRRLLTLVAAVLVGCSAASPSPSPSVPADLSEAELRLAIIDQVGEPWFCDPDEYPVPRDEAAQAQERLPEIQADAETYLAITGRLGISTDEEPGAEARLEIYRLWKRLNAIALTPAGEDAFRFEVLTRASSTPEGGVRTTGSIDRNGAIEVKDEVPAGEPECPICLGRGTLIATPSGSVPVERLRIGDLVWSVDAQGRRVAVALERVGSTPVPANHRLTIVRLADGRMIAASAGHPLADGRPIGDIRAGDRVDESIVVSVTTRAYAGGRTFDILPAGTTGLYWADGVLLGSTLAD